MQHNNSHGTGGWKVRKSRKKWIFAGLLSILLVFTAVAAAIGGEGRKKQLSIVYIPKIIDDTNDFWKSLIQGVETAAQEYNVDLEILAPSSEQDYEGQNRYIREILERTKKPDALMISPCSYTESTDLLETVTQEGIRLIFVDSSVDRSIGELTVSTDNLEAGKLLGEFAATLLPADGKAAIVGHVEGASTAIEREKGFREGMGDRNQDIVDVVFCDSQYEKAYELTREMMDRYPDLRMIAGLNEYSAIGAARAVKDAGEQDRIVLVGIDSSQEGISLMEEGIVKGFVIQKPFKMGYLGVKNAVALLEGKEADAQVDAGSQLVTLENLYDRENEKLLFPFSEEQAG